jgi:hypothetical protein
MYSFVVAFTPELNFNLALDNPPVAGDIVVNKDNGFAFFVSSKIVTAKDTWAVLNWTGFAGVSP